MQNFDIKTILPLLLNGKGDLNTVLSAMGYGNKPPDPPNTANSEFGGNYAHIHEMPKVGQNGGMDPAALMQLMAALNAKKNAHAPPPPEPAPTATKEIRESLQTILTLNALDNGKPQ